MEKTEGEIQADICQYLDTQSEIVYSVTNSSGSKSRGGWLHRGARCISGWPDITGVLGPSGRFFAIECKTKRGKLTGEQAHILGKLQRRGALIIVGRSVGEVATQLNKVLYGSTNHM